MRWNDAHQSGKFKATTLQRHRMTDAISRRTRIFGTTEARGLIPPVKWRGTGGESKVVADMRVWTLVDSGVVSLSTNRWFRGRSPRKTVDLEWSLYRHNDSGETLLRLVAHLPAHLYLWWQRRANSLAVRKLSGVVSRLQKRLKPDHTDLSMDLNRDLRLHKNVALVRQSLQGTGMHLVIPPKGTHGDRKIDMIASTGHAQTVQMLPHFPGHDHRGFWVIFREVTEREETP